MAEFAQANTATVKMKIDLNADGKIAQEGDEIAGSKTPSLAGIKPTATLAEAETVFNAFYGQIAGASYDSLSAVKTITQGVAK